MIELNHLSYSSIKCYLDCPANFKFRYIDKLPTKPSPALIFGSAWHGTVETFIRSAKKPDLLKTWQDNWGKQLETNQDIEWGDDTPESICNDGVKMAQSAEIQALLSTLKPKRVGEDIWIEKKVELHVPGVSIPIIGYIDFIGEDGIPGDFKTSARSWSDDQAANEMQPLFYLAALNQAGIPTPGFKFRHYIFVKTKTPKVQVFETIYTINDLVFLFKTISNVWDAIQKEAFCENSGTWLCGSKYCNFWRFCRGKSST